MSSLILIIGCMLLGVPSRSSRAVTFVLATLIAFLYRFVAHRAEEAIATPRVTFWRRVGRDQRALNRATRCALSQAEFFTQYPQASYAGVELFRRLQRLRRR